jgi:hypothetical protein
LPNVKELCEKITPQTPVEMFLLGSPNPLGATVIDVIHSYTYRARQLNRQILDLSPYLASDLIDLIALIEDHGELDKYEQIYAEYRQGRLAKTGLAGIAPVLFNYLQIVDRVDKYRKAFDITTYKAPPYLLRGTTESDAIPLEEEMGG